MSVSGRRQQVEALVARAGGLPQGEGRVRLLEEAVRQADALGEVALAFEARSALVEAATFGGFPRVAHAAFAWCCEQAAADPGHFDDLSLLWKYKWVVARLPDFPEVSAQQVLDALDEAQRAFQRAGLGERALLKLRYHAAREMGDGALAQALWERWRAAPRDALTDCPACELDDELDLHLDRGEWLEALAKARPILDGKCGCAEVPHLTLGTLLHPLLRLGEREEALACHLRGYALVRDNRDFLATVGEHLEFLALTGNLERGLALLEHHLGWALEDTSARTRFTFLCAATLLFGQVEAAHPGPLTLRLPSTFPARRPHDTYPPAALHAWAQGEAEALARRFDARNGTGRFGRLLERSRTLAAEARSWPLAT